MLPRSSGSTSGGSSPAYGGSSPANYGGNLPAGGSLDGAHRSAVRASMASMAMASMVYGVESPNQRMSLLPIPQATATDFSSAVQEAPDITALLAGYTSDSAASAATDTDTMAVESLFSEISEDLATFSGADSPPPITSMGQMDHTMGPAMGDVAGVSGQDMWYPPPLSQPFDLVDSLSMLA
jgi:hypothetical protein